jgi:hypothetical protein
LSPRAVAGVDGARSERRWSDAPLADRALLVLVGDGVDGATAPPEDRLADAFRGQVVPSLPARVDAPLVVVVSGEPPALFAARLRQIARTPAMAGKLLAAWSLAGPIRPDLPASLLGEGRLAGIGIAEGELVGRRDVSGELERLSQSLGERRAEHLAGPFLWYF